MPDQCDDLISLLDAPDHAVALRAPDGTQCTYQQLRQQLVEFASQLSACGVASDHRVVTLLPDSASTAVAQLALSACATAIPVNPRLTRDEIFRALDKLSPDAVITAAEDSDMQSLVAARGAPVLALQLQSEPARHCGALSIRLVSGSVSTPAGTNRGDIGLVLPTSGSTGGPKQVPLTRHAMACSARTIASTLGLGPSDIAVHMLPMFHIGAVVDLLLAPLCAGGTVQFAHPIATESLKRVLLDRPCTWMQGVPTMLINLVAACSEAELLAIGEKLRLIRSVSSDLSAERQSELEEAFAGTPIIAMYGMTETAGQIASNPLPPAQRRPGSVGLADGAEIMIADAFANPVQAGQSGEIFVSGPTVTPGYEGVTRSEHFIGRWLRTGDTGRIDAEGYLWLTGRKKDIINRGGEKIASQDVDRALMAHPAVQEAAAFGVGHASLGEDVAAAVTLRPGRHASADELRKELATHLASHKLPRRIVVLDALPKLGSGKIDRNALRRMFDSSVSAGGGGEPVTPLGKRLAAMWRKALNRPELGLDDDFFELGGDSLMATTLMLTLEEQFGTSLPANLLYEAPTLRQFEQRFDQHVAPPYEGPLPAAVFNAVKSAMMGWSGQRRHSWSLVASHNGASEGQALFWCCAGVEQWQHLVGASAAERPVHLLRSLSGLSVKSKANTALLAEHYADEIAALQPHGEIALGGFCQGAVVTRQIAERLQARGRRIALHVVVDRRFDTPDQLPTAYFWGTDTIHSGAAVFASPDRALPRLHPAGAKSFHLDYTHGELTLWPAATCILQHLTALLDAGLSTTPGVEANPSPLAPVRARISARTPFWASPGELLQLQVSLQNTGETAWHASDHQRYSLAARWRNLDGHPRMLNAGSVPLPARVSPGETIAVTLPVCFPQRGLPMVLLLDVVDEGAFWFHERGGRPFQRLVLCKGLPQRAARAAGNSEAVD